MRNEGAVEPEIPSIYNTDYIISLNITSRSYAKDSYLSFNLAYTMRSQVSSVKMFNDLLLKVGDAQFNALVKLGEFGLGVVRSFLQYIHRLRFLTLKSNKEPTPIH